MKLLPRSNYFALQALIFAFTVGVFAGCAPSIPGSDTPPGTEPWTPGRPSEAQAAPQIYRSQSTQSAESAKTHLIDLLGLFAARYSQAQVHAQAASASEKERLFSEAIGQSNLGNTCYANAAHALLWAMNLTNAAPFDLHAEPAPASWPNLQVVLRGFLQSFQDYLFSILSGPRNPSGYLDRHHPLLGHQHDSAEYLSKVLELFESTQPLQNPIGTFQLATQVVFDDGRFNPVRLNAELRNRWELYLETSDHSRSLQEFFNHLFAPVDVTNVAWEENPNIQLPGQQRTYLIRSGDLPRLVLLQANRFRPDRSKIVGKVMVTPQISIPYYENVGAIHGAPAQHRLQLKGAIIHHGVSSESGHYTTIVYHSEHWFEHDDSQIRAITPEQAYAAFNENGYVFLYGPAETLSPPMPQSESVKNTPSARLSILDGNPLDPGVDGLRLRRNKLNSAPGQSLDGPLLKRRR